MNNKHIDGSMSAWRKPMSVEASYFSGGAVAADQSSKQNPVQTINNSKVPTITVNNCTPQQQQQAVFQSVQSQMSFEESPAFLMRKQFVQLFLQPWDQFQIMLEKESDSQQLKEAFLQAKKNIQSNLQLLLIDAASQASNGEFDLQTKLLGMSNSLNAAQLVRLQQEVEKERREKKLYAEKLLKYKKKWDDVKSKVKKSGPK